MDTGYEKFAFLNNYNKARTDIKIFDELLKEQEIMMIDGTPNRKGKRNRNYVLKKNAIAIECNNSIETRMLYSLTPIHYIVNEKFYKLDEENYAITGAIRDKNTGIVSIIDANPYCIHWELMDNDKSYCNDFKIFSGEKFACSLCEDENDYLLLVRCERKGVNNLSYLCKKCVEKNSFSPIKDKIFTLLCSDYKNIYFRNEESFMDGKKSNVLKNVAGYHTEKVLAIGYILNRYYGYRNVRSVKPTTRDLFDIVMNNKDPKNENYKFAQTILMEVENIDNETLRESLIEKSKKENSDWCKKVHQILKKDEISKYDLNIALSSLLLIDGDESFKNYVNYGEIINYHEGDEIFYEMGRVVKIAYSRAFSKRPGVMIPPDNKIESLTIRTLNDNIFLINKDAISFDDTTKLSLDNIAIGHILTFTGKVGAKNTLSKCIVEKTTDYMVTNKIVSEGLIKHS